MIKRILIGLGGTPFTSVAIDRAVELAKQNRASITAVTVVDIDKLCRVGPIPPGASAYARKLCENRLGVNQNHVEASIDALEKRCDQSGVDLTIEQESGGSFDLLISHARYNDVTIFGLRSIFDYELVNDPEKDLIKLLSKGVRPIIAVSTKFRAIKKVMIAYDGTVESANAMQHFVRLNIWPEAALDIVHIGSDQDMGKRLISDAAAYCIAHGYIVSTRWFEGKAADHLLPAAQQTDADMIVMGRSVRGVVARRILGDTLLKTLTTTDRPLFLSQ